MNNWLLFLLKSSLVLSLLYLVFRLLMQDETLFRISRLVLLSIVFTSVVIPFIYLPQSNQPFVSINLDPFFHGSSIIEKPVQIGETKTATYSSIANADVSQAIVISTKMVLLIVHLIGVFVSLLLFVYSIFSVFRMFRRSLETTRNGIEVKIHNADIPAFSFRRCILISQHDYETNADAILTHELSHIKNRHFYDLMLMELVKIIYWFNPLVYRMDRDLKEIHEYQADECTINSGIDATKYQLLLIQKCVGQQKFALANSFNNYQIKKRIAMINKSKTNKAWPWKVAVFLPLFALLLVAFGKRNEIAPHNNGLSIYPVASSELVKKQYVQSKRKIEIKKDGNYLDNKLCSLQDIANKGQEWYNAKSDWIFLIVEESIPLSRIDEVREALTHSYWIVQKKINSDDFVFFAGDVSEGAKFIQGTWKDWMNSQFKKYPEFKSEALKISISYSYIISKDGTVRDAHIIKGCNYPEINAAFERILNQMPDWEPAKRGSEKVSVYYKF